MLLVDTNVLLDSFTDDERWRPWSERAVADAVVAGGVGINPIIYAEASLTFGDAETLDRSLNALLVERLPLPWSAAFGAGRGGPIGGTAALAGRGRRRCPASI